LADGDVQGDYRAAGREFNGLGSATLQLVIELLHQPSAKTNNRFGGFPVPMDGKRRARLNGVQHSLGFVFLGVSEVVVHTKAGGLFGLFSQAIQ
jgi:hypothetical protein